MGGRSVPLGPVDVVHRADVDATGGAWAYRSWPGTGPRRRSRSRSRRARGSCGASRDLVVRLRPGRQSTSSPRSSPSRAASATAAGKVETAASRPSAVSGAGVRITVAPCLGADALGLGEERILGRRGQAQRQRAGPSAIIADVAPSLVSTWPSAGIPATSQEQRGLERARPRGAAAEGDRRPGLASPPGRRPTSRAGDRGLELRRETTKRNVERRVARHLRPDGERRDDRSRTPVCG